MSNKYNIHLSFHSNNQYNCHVRRYSIAEGGVTKIVETFGAFTSASNAELIGYSEDQSTISCRNFENSFVIGE